LAKARTTPSLGFGLRAGRALSHQFQAMLSEGCAVAQAGVLIGLLVVAPASRLRTGVRLLGINPRCCTNTQPPQLQAAPVHYAQGVQALHSCTGCSGLRPRGAVLIREGGAEQSCQTQRCALPPLFVQRLRQALLLAGRLTHVAGDAHTSLAGYAACAPNTVQAASRPKGSPSHFALLRSGGSTNNE